MQNSYLFLQSNKRAKEKFLSSVFWRYTILATGKIANIFYNWFDCRRRQPTAKNKEVKDCEGGDFLVVCQKILTRSLTYLSVIQF
ncbi:hypothetical protein EGW67_13725 [Enterococcus faecium]|nr:hypothetical protein C7K43_12365 [Tetragenococcus koreensis]EGP5318143.1 hypothetical protein [Enterococcus faecium]EGP5328344.1 hypothetical protein [Enterococcus faecium]EGP5701948.1 hypothetical protein [Enterococcus faecium]PQE95915.1 hypothetical protein CUS94_12410 [Enterococcus faecium]